MSASSKGDQGQDGLTRTNLNKTHIGCWSRTNGNNNNNWCTQTCQSIVVYMPTWRDYVKKNQGMPKNWHYFLHRKWEQDKKLQSTNSVPRHVYSFGKLALVYWERRGWFVEIVIGNTIFTTMVNWFRKKLLIHQAYGEWLLRHGYSFSSSFFLWWFLLFTIVLRIIQ